MSDNTNETERATSAPGARKPRRAIVGLRAAALAGVVLSAGALGIAAPVDTQPDTTDTTETVVSDWWPMGTTCCPEDPS